MSEYIEREALLSEVKTLRNQARIGKIEAARWTKIIAAAPAADVEKVKRGTWTDRHGHPLAKMYGVMSGRCSRCGLYSGAWSTNQPYRYCPYCGARMGSKEAARNE